MPSKVAGLIERIDALDHRAAVMAAATCARTVLDIVPAGEDGPRELIEAVEAWVRGERTGDEVLAMLPDGPRYTVAAISSLVRESIPTPTRYLSGRGLGQVADSAAHTRAALACQHLSLNRLLESPEFKARRKACLDEMFGLAAAVPWPSTVPSDTDLAGAPLELQAAWQVVAEAEDKLTIGELDKAIKRAAKLGLDIHDPVARAIAERATSAAITRKLEAALSDA